MELQSLHQIERATRFGRPELAHLGVAVLFVAAVIVYTGTKHAALPDSATHIAVGAVFGVGFLREHLKTSCAAKIEEMRAHHAGEDQATLDAFLRRFELASFEEKGAMLEQLKQHRASAELSKQERKGLGRIYRQDVVKRSALLRVVAAWPVPASGMLLAMHYFTIRGRMLP